MGSFDSFYNSDDLLERLTIGVSREVRPVVFLVGSAITAPVRTGALGVPGAAEIVELIRAEFDSPSAQSAFDSAVESASNRYQAAFHFLLGRRSQEIANEIVKKAVWRSRKTLSDASVTYAPSASTEDHIFETSDSDSDLDGWSLSPAVDALGQLATYYPDQFGKQILTTNFDPLIEVSIQRHGGRQFRTVLQRDGDLSQTTAVGCHVIHLHGYWYGADTLHTVRQLTQDRPRLKHALGRILQDKTLVVCGYGGWDDIFTKALMDVALDDVARPQILWTFFDESPSLQSELLEILSPGLDRGRVLANFERKDDVEYLLSQYAATVPSRDARYINYCDMRCYAYWVQQKYSDAIEWGTRGKELKEKTNVDTDFDTRHNLALAQRDSGVVDAALTAFLSGIELASVVDPDEFDETRYHAFYGNIGRCLHLMGQIEPALVCYRKSAILLQTARYKHVEDQGYIRSWIGELLIAKEEFCTGSRFLQAAKLKWQLVSPGRCQAIDALLAKNETSFDGCAPLDDRNVERYCVAWIFGRESDFLAL